MMHDFVNRRFDETIELMRAQMDEASPENGEDISGESVPVAAVSLWIPITLDMMRDMGMAYGPFVDETQEVKCASRPSVVATLNRVISRVRGAWDVLRGHAWAQYEEEEPW